MSNEPAGQTDQPRWIYAPPSRHILHAGPIGQDFRIDVMLPFRLEGDTRRYPVVYVTDGNSNFDALKGIAYSLQRTGTDAPPFILVGIGYPGDSPRSGRFLRRRDFTAPGYPRLDLLTAQVAQPGELGVPPDSPDLHGADAFLDFLDRQLFPFVEREYPATADRTIFGHSGGAMFGLYALFTRERLFSRYILSSPCIVYEGFDAAGAHISSAFLAPYLAAYLARPATALKRLFLSVGSLEEVEAPAWRLVSSLALLAERLRKARRNGLSIIHEVIDGETHMSVWPIAFIRGLRAVLPLEDQEP